ncbi:unnamed protein product [Diatraea saccharalis]|uniref:C2H2-type domain-containing protein n=1 Tax=Diatraea saccharalis TaxID=40085 RepID=A0A9N9WG89_9NEOP|nr:unnamed protein product [Diatraea saccharalis]
MCAYCQTYCHNGNELRAHSVTHNKMEIFENNNLRATFPLRIDVTNLTCTICNEAINNNCIEGLKRHLNVVHSKIFNTEYKDGVIPFLLTENIYKCVLCGLKFERSQSLFAHMNKHYQSFVCHTCGKAFALRHTYRSHQACHDIGHFSCNKCDSTFDNRAIKNRHVAAVHGRKDKYRCPLCNDHFDSYYARLRHLDKVHGQKVEYRCNFCPSVFGTGALRYSHMKSVHKTKIYRKMSQQSC